MTLADARVTAQDPADIGPEDLWVVWLGTPKFLQNLGEAPVTTEWMLAPAGQEGLRQLAGEDGFSEDLIAAMPLALLRQVALALPSAPANGLPGWVRAALGGSEALIFARNEAGATRIVSSEREMLAGEREILKGARDDFDRVLNEGNRILEEKDWRKVFGDMRSFVTRGEVGWLDYQQNPEGAAILERLFKEFPDEG